MGIFVKCFEDLWKLVIVFEWFDNFWLLYEVIKWVMRDYWEFYFFKSCMVNGGIINIGNGRRICVRVVLNMVC